MKLSLEMITSSSKSYNFSYPKLLNTHFEFENGPVPWDEDVKQYYQNMPISQGAIPTSFCSVRIRDEIFILGGNATYGYQGVNVFKIEITRNVHLKNGHFIPVYNQIKKGFQTDCSLMALLANQTKPHRL